MYFFWEITSVCSFLLIGYTKTEEAINIVKELVKEYDIVLEQFRPGVMEKLGLGYEELKKVNPKLIYHFRENMGVGLRFSYDRSMLDLASAEISVADTIVTNARCNKAYLNQLKELGIDVIV